MLQATPFDVTQVEFSGAPLTTRVRASQSNSAAIQAVV